MALPEIWLIRHGETEWSRSGRHTGRTDIPLTDAGLAEATEVRASVQAHEFGRVLCSPLLRARQTCEAAGMLERAEIRDELQEWDYGGYEGLRTTEIQVDRPDWLLWRDGVPAGESPADVSARLGPVIAELCELDEDAVAFAHGHILRALAAEWIRAGTAAGQRLPLATGTVSVLGYEHDYPVICSWNLPPPTD